MKQSLALIVPLALAACENNQSYIGFHSYDGSYMPGEHQLYGPDIQTYVRGSPFPGLAADPGTAATIADMQDGGFYNTRFTTATIPRSPYWVLMLFDPPVSTNLERLCETNPQTIPEPPPRSPQPPGTRAGLAAVFCRGPQLMGGAIGSVPVAGGPGDPAVKGAIQGFMRELFPPRNPIPGAGGFEMP
jgi:hypothetical protein